MKITPYFLFFGISSGASGAAIFWEELSYFSAEDSPFYAGIQAGTIYLEDFEDHELNTPNVISWDFPQIIGVDSNGNVSQSRQRGLAHRAGKPNRTWSVDGDDGLLGDFLGSGGDTWTTQNVSNGQQLGSMEFRFTPDAEGRYPTFVGFVVTEPFIYTRDVEFGTSTLTGPESSDNSFDPLTWIPRLSFPGDTRTHRFFGIEVESGITRLNIRNVAQIDHLQYGYAIPEPSVIGLLLPCGLMALRRHRQQGRRTV